MFDAPFQGKSQSTPSSSFIFPSFVNSVSHSMMADEKNSAHGSLPTKIDDNGRIVPVNTSSGNLESEEAPTASVSNSLEGQDHIDYVEGTRFWLITSS
jgi:hypothetical protein